ncbi:MAG: hypothetical protein WC023_09355 [Rhodocyclaceae bacterium]
MGIRIHGATREAAAAASGRFLAALAALGLDPYVRVSDASEEADSIIRYRLRDDFAETWAPDSDTTHLCEQLALDTKTRSEDIEREILLALLLSPHPFHFPSYEELRSAVNIRRNIVEAARKTALAFDTAQAERPEEYWRYHETTGFTLHPGKPIIPALIQTTQPEESGSLFSFSCYRATEYVILLAIAQELADCNPALLEQLQQQWETRAIMSGEFHEVFLTEYGTMETPLPPRYYVPGDRLWFRNPDDRSSDVSGYEGSWVFYLGDGKFSNFWKRNQPYTLTSKCLEIYHWRHGACHNEAGELQIDEARVDAHVAESLNDTQEVQRIFGAMMRYRDPKGVYADGGCIDTSRECPRWVCPGTAAVVLPDAVAPLAARMPTAAVSAASYA